MSSSTLRLKTIAIIGAGPSGLVAAKYFLAEKAFSKIAVFEQRSSIGGIWNYTPEDQDEVIFTIPQTDPRGKVDDPIWRSPTKSPHVQNGSNEEREVKKVASFISPLYEKLETNIPRGLMGFSDLNWPTDSQLFPKHETVLEYIQEYGQDVKYLVRLETQVIDVSAVESEVSESGRWKVQSRNLASQEVIDEVYDAVVVANGHFIVPYVPHIEGIREWNTRYPGLISHSKYFRRPDEFRGKKVIVIGNSASGIDISSQIAPICQHPLLWSNKSTSMLSPTFDSRKLELPPIAAFLPEHRSVRFENGRVESDIDAIVFCTGYFYSLPFIRNLEPELIKDGTHVQHTYKHLFYAPQPTLSFLVLPQRVIPFPVAEAQSAVLARVYSGRLSLPSYDEMRKWEEQNIAEMGSGRNFHLLPFPEDANYINEMSNWASCAPPIEGLENEGKGKVPPTWGAWEMWARENFPKIRRVFGEKGEERRNVRTLEELGFNFERDLKERKR
ncbi:flavin-containing monooxygenase [Lepidopterella palustris CBS 459.81]|uniref:Flavin-containing monooxygenase n=1 Tax=Lepidopterella palustris CBS 459.81 TaxID=1314670 RepID=A0A8E2JCC7_9PEZI|nr:flavin-containing monooxygenase [Lepidopterella palustris CBS 459.81]